MTLWSPSTRRTRGGEIVLFPDLLSDLDPFPVDGVQDLLARTLDDPDSLLSLLRSEPIGDGDRYCFAAVNMVYDPTRTDGVVSEESALAPCDESRRRTLYDADEMWDGVLPDVAGTHSWIHQEFLTNLAWVQADSWLAWGAYAPACSNGVDDDEDGWTDLDDPGCAIGDERAVGHDQPCNDGVDDDGDGLADSADPDCDDGYSTEDPYSVERDPSVVIGVDDLVVASSIGFGAVWIADAMPAGAVTDADLPITIAGDATHSRASSAHGVGDADGDGYTDLVVYTSSASQ